jgi:hypothetical protein
MMKRLLMTICSVLLTTASTRSRTLSAVRASSSEAVSRATGTTTRKYSATASIRNANAISPTKRITIALRMVVAFNDR